MEPYDGASRIWIDTCKEGTKDIDEQILEAF